jgi:hypothetical protein
MNWWEKMKLSDLSRVIQTGKIPKRVNGRSARVFLPGEYEKANTYFQEQSKKSFLKYMGWG